MSRREAGTELESGPERRQALPDAKAEKKICLKRPGGKASEDVVRLWLSGPAG